MEGDETFLAGSPMITRPPPFALRSSSPPPASDLNLSRGPPPPPTFLRGVNSGREIDAEGPLPVPPVIKPRPRFSLFAPLRPAGQLGQNRTAKPGTSDARARTATTSTLAEEEGQQEVGDQTIGPDQHRKQTDANDAAGDEGDEPGAEGEGKGDQTIHASAQITAEERDDRLRESLYELRSMNEVFDGFLEALESARGHNEVCMPC
jgi:hypothetical protein